MRISIALIWPCAFVILCACTADVGPNAVARRQEVEATIPETSPSSTSNEPSETQETSTSRFSTSTGAATSAIDTGNAASSFSTSTSTNAVPSATSTVNGPVQTSSNVTDVAEGKHPGGLPLPPKITPVLSIAGVFLIVAGFTYTLIGIKNRWIQIFLSSAFLTSLSVTVLVVYVMNPPVRMAVQGAYLVAAFMTGVIFGAGSLIFKEVTEGLGCLLGGFCLSMWLLALRPGGTVSSTEGKVVLIAAFSTTVYALSFSRYTRPYGLIGATSFAGATAVALGLDCFSRAGLKEFWLYIWNLNDNLFPLNTNTYPITRGMRVELAFIVLICFLGVISQLKLWRVVKDRREKRDADRLENERERNQMEEAIGRRLEEGNERERAQWEAVYGDQEASKHTAAIDSGLETEEDNSLQKASVSVREVEGSSAPAEVMNDKDAAKIPVGVWQEKSSSSRPNPNSFQHAGDSLDDSTNAPNTVNTKEAELLHSPLSPILQRPFAISSAKKPGAHVRVEIISDDNENLMFTSLGDEDDMNPGGFYSKDSSLAATVDEEREELISLSYGQEHAIPFENKSAAEVDILPDVVITPFFDSLQPLEDVKASLADIPRSTADDSDPEEFQRPAVVSPEPQTSKALFPSNHNDARFKQATTSPHLRSSVPESRTDDSQAQDITPKSNEALSIDAVSNTESLTKGALDKVPSQLSHVVLSYRTNEWAKHISTADEPEFDKLEVSTEDAVAEVPAHLVEQPAPVHAEKVQRIAKTMAISPMLAQDESCAPAPSKLTPIVSGKSNASSSTVPSGRSSLDSPVHPDGFQASSSQLRQKSESAAGLTESASAASLLPPPGARALRSCSTSMPGHNLKTSPIDENVEAEFRVSASCGSLAPLAGSTLLAQRDSLLRNKHSFITKSTAMPPDITHAHPPFRSSSRLSLIEEAQPRSVSPLSNLDNVEAQEPLRSASRLTLLALNDDDMPLSQRKALMQQKPGTLLPETRLGAANNLDAHLPQWSSVAMTPQKRESMLATWRQSMRQEMALTSVPTEAVETRRAEMLIEKRQSKMSRDYSEATKVHQENAFAEAVRSGDMQDLHKEALRKMQANANKHIS
ncbi:hypothetical protein EPUS_06542 [Endocarpon pusillum Z07020]|uniref:TM7S3/TM198-like domain-containing protein n=1 Tax=Endocarpon pusillum (strain Z07020 / HMAS-L-300199) TaxID=1263415 RepID=U1GMF4_ENDPU|nr:uncharacterized protein EPUS_06542 [Endocarpon pusillum Z07020]ERF73081.1 hypothetical protein EPUS_06542 [Endocarpon pusillum Z07020]